MNQKEYDTLKEGFKYLIRDEFLAYGRPTEKEFLDIATDAIMGDDDVWEIIREKIQKLCF